MKAIAEDDFGPGPFAVYDPMFTAILGTRALVNLMYGGRKLEKLSI